MVYDSPVLFFNGGDGDTATSGFFTNTFPQMVGGCGGKSHQLPTKDERQKNLTTETQRPLRKDIESLS
jgi:hypothetical protein